MQQEIERSIQPWLNIYSDLIETDRYGMIVSIKTKTQQIAEENQRIRHLERIYAHLPSAEALILIIKSFREGKDVRINIHRTVEMDIFEDFTIFICIYSDIISEDGYSKREARFIFYGSEKNLQSMRKQARDKTASSIRFKSFVCGARLELYSSNCEIRYRQNPMFTRRWMK